MVSVYIVFTNSWPPASTDLLVGPQEANPEAHAEQRVIKQKLPQRLRRQSWSTGEQPLGDDGVYEHGEREPDHPVNGHRCVNPGRNPPGGQERSEEHTSELQSRGQ